MIPLSTSIDINKLRRRGPSGLPLLEIPLWSTLPEDIQILAARAENGSVEALQGLVLCIATDDTTGFQPRTLQVLQSHLMKKPHHEWISESSLRVLKLATISLDGTASSVLKLKDVHQTPLFSHFMFDRSFRRAIWTWVDYLYSRIYPNGLLRHHDPKSISENDKMTLKSIHILVTHLLGFGDDLKLPEIPNYKADSHRGFFILADIWIRLSGAPFDSDARFAEIREHIAIEMVLFFDMDLRKWPLALAKELEGGVSKLSSVCLDYMRLSLSSNVADECQLSAFSRVITLIIAMGHNIPGLLHVLLSQHIMLDMTRVFGIFTRRLVRDTSAKMHSNEVLDDCASSSLWYINNCFGVSDVPIWITQSLRSGLLQYLLQFAVFVQRRAATLGVHQNENGHGEEDLLWVLYRLRPYCIYRSVIRQLERSLKHPQTLECESLLSRDAEFGNAWFSFKRYAEAYISLKLGFDADGKYSQQCAAPECGNREENEYYHVCASCHTTSYCSKKCQARDWKFGGHRALCKKIGKDHEAGTPSPISQLDKNFISFKVMADLEAPQTRRGILKRRNKFFPGESKPEFVIVFSYICYPLRITVTVPRLLPPSIRPLVSNPTPLKGGKQAAPPLVTLVLRIPHGTHAEYGIVRSDRNPTALSWALERIGEESVDDMEAHLTKEETEYFEIPCFRDLDPEWIGMVSDLGGLLDLLSSGSAAS